MSMCCPGAASPVVVPDTSSETRLCPQYHVMLHNDDVNDMWHVCRSLMSILSHNEEDAIEIMLKAHNEGVAVAKTESKEHAEFHQEQLQAVSLTVTIEPAE